MSGLIASYRWRRRLLWLLAVAAAGGVATILVLVFPEPEKHEEPLSSRQIAIKPDRVPKSVALKGSARAEALAVADLFIHTAVARRNVDRAWPLASAELKQGLSRREWDTGNMPVAPYPVGDMRWDVDYSYRNLVGFQIALFPSRGSNQPPEVFLLDLKAVGKGPHRHWLVKAWNPTPIANIRTPPTGGGVMDRVTPRVAASSGHGRLSAAWLLLPVGLLSLALLVPISIGVTRFYRGRKIVRAYLNEQNARH